MPDSPAAPDDVPTRIAVLEEISRHTSVTLDRIDRRLETLDKRLDTHFRWLVGLYLARIVSILGVLAHGFHWL
jgi:hypothetical protein